MPVKDSIWVELAWLIWSLNLSAAWDFDASFRLGSSPCGSELLPNMLVIIKLVKSTRSEISNAVLTALTIFAADQGQL